MPLFICDSCGSVENTACGDHVRNLIDLSVPKLCSACSPARGRRWHGRFERRVATPELRAAVPDGRFSEMPEGMRYKDLPLHLDAAHRLRVSRAMAQQLRHRPDPSLGMDRAGFVSLAALTDLLVGRGLVRDAAEVLRVVAEDDKGRFELVDDEDGRGVTQPEMARVRAVSGHSLEVELGYAEYVPSHPLYFGTVEASAERILADGLVRSPRRHVRLVQTEEAAWAVADARLALAPDVKWPILCGPAVFRVDAEQMAADGKRFHLASNGEVLSPEVEVRYIRQAVRALTPLPR